MGDMGISSMIQMMLETSKDFDGFDAITLTVELNGKKLRINNKCHVFTMSVRDIALEEQAKLDRREQRWAAINEQYQE